MLTHVPYRNWCPFCVKGRGRQESHRKAEEERRKVPHMMIDYACLNPEDPEGKRPLIIMKDCKSGKVTGMMVPRKGDDGKAIALVAREIKRIGYGTFVWRSDQESLFY